MTERENVTTWGSAPEKERGIIQVESEIRASAAEVMERADQAFSAYGFVCQRVAETELVAKILVERRVPVYVSPQSLQPARLFSRIDLHLKEIDRSWVHLRCRADYQHVQNKTARAILSTVLFGLPAIGLLLALHLLGGSK